MNDSSETPRAKGSGPPRARTGSGGTGATDAPEPRRASGAPDRSEGPDTSGLDFVRTIVEQHLAEGRYEGVVTRFPPEPNGLLHLGHAKAIVLNFGLAEEYDGRCHLRFDDTNPLTEEASFARAIREDVRWLGYDWGEHLYHASDYFGKLYDFAEELVRKGKAYVDSQSEEEIRENRGSLVEPGTPSPYRSRSVEENLDLLRRMRAGEFAEGEHVLRAKIDMAHPNMVMRDPVLYRILHASHYRTGDEWCIYPLYDYAHCLEDAIEDVTHSLCTLEFDNNREIYDWILDEVGFTEPRPHQYEFARLDLEHTVLSKRKLRPLVEEGVVDGWDDPRLFTLAAVRRRGVPPEAVRRFCEMIGVTKANTRVDAGKFEWAVRDTLNTTAPRVMCVLRPLDVVLTNWPEGRVDLLDAPHWPRDVDREGTREVPFGRRLRVERTDFDADPPKGWKRLAPGASVRLRHGYVITVDEVVTGDDGEPVELRCTCHTDSLGSNPDGVKVAGVVHWVSADHALPCTVRLYDRLFAVPDPTDVPEGTDVTVHLNPDSLVVLDGALVEPSVADDPPETRYQFERTGYFWRDPGPSDALPDRAESVDEPTGDLVFNRIVSLRDGWSKRRAEAEEAREERAPPGRSGRREPDLPEGPVGGTAGGGAGMRPGPPPTGPEDRVSDERRGAREADPELQRRFERYQEELGLSLDDADVLTGSVAIARFFEEALEAHDEPEGVAAWVVNEVMREVKERPVDELPFGGRQVGRLARMVDEGRVSRVAAKDVFAAMVASGADPETVVEERGLEKVDDPDVLEPLVERILADHPEEVAAYLGGKEGLAGFFVGRVMRETGGSADPKLAKAMIEGKLEEGAGGEGGETAPPEDDGG